MRHHNTTTVPPDLHVTQWTRLLQNSNPDLRILTPILNLGVQLGAPNGPSSPAVRSSPVRLTVPQPDEVSLAR